MMPTDTSVRSATWPMISISANSRLAISKCISSTCRSRKSGKHGLVAAQSDGATLVVAEAQVGRQAAFADDRRHGAVEDIDQAATVFAMRVAAHRRLIDRHFLATRLDQRHQLAAHQRQQGFRDRVPIGIGGRRHESTAERVRAGHAGLEHRAGRSQPPQSPELVHGTQTARGSEVARNAVFAALVVRGRTKAARAGPLQLNPRPNSRRMTD